METSPIHSSDQLIQRALEIAVAGRKKKVAVAAAQDIDVIDAVSQAAGEGFLHGILVGDGDAIAKLAFEKNIDIENLQIIDEKDVGRAAHKAVALASRGILAIC